MKVLIISSEPLDPSNTLPSTFELTQAQILSRQFDVAIISVRSDASLTGMGRALLRKLLGRKEDKTYATIFGHMSRAFLHCTGLRKVVRKHTIEGIAVYEGIGYHFRGPGNPVAALNVWVEAGMRAFAEAAHHPGNTPVVVHAHGRFLFAGALALEVKKKYGFPYVYTDHSTFYQRGIAPAALKDVLGKIVDNASRVIMVSRSLLSHVEGYLGRPLPEAVILPNVVDTLFESPLPARPPANGQSELPAANREFIFVNVASLEHKKGQDLLIRAFAKAFRSNPFIKLHLCGNGPLADELKAQCRQLRHSRVRRIQGLAVEIRSPGRSRRVGFLYFPAEWRPSASS
ncbi:glycosyltransferase [Puia sp. P3]|uniref:glycosyltransferase n=1 Tax=Puia sp. P3 TaxID=3423952 RepID=UPI003D66D2A7